MGRDGYSKYIDYLTIEGGWVNINRLAFELGVSKDCAHIAIKRALAAQRIEVRRNPGYPIEARVK